jgi:RNA polymerase sigma factor (sigma-70 family)
LKIFFRNYTDKEVLEAIRNGKDDYALNYLYKEVLPLVKNYILKNQGTTEEAKDIFQDAVIRFYNAVKQEKFMEKCSVSTFLIGISKNLWINAQVRKKRYIPGNNLEFVQDSINLLDEIISDEKLAGVNNLLKELGENCEKIMKYAVYDNLSMKEISDKMGYANENVAKSNNYRCKQKLIQLLKDKPNMLELFDW